MKSFTKKTVSSIALSCILLLVITGKGHAQTKGSSASFEYAVGATDYKIPTRGYRYFSALNDRMTIFDRTFDDNIIYISSNNMEKLIQIAPGQTKINVLNPIEGVGEVDGVGYLFFSDWNGKTNSFDLTYDKIDYNSSKYPEANDAKLATSVNEKLKEYANYKEAMVHSMDVEKRFNIMYSHDRKIVLASGELHPGNKNSANNYDRLSVNVFSGAGGTFKDLWKGVIKMPYTEKSMFVMDAAVNNNGDVCFLAKVFNNNSRDITTSGGAINYHYEAICVKSGTTEGKTVKIGDGKKFISDIYIKDRPDGSFACAGYYSSLKNDDDVGAEGVLACLFDADGNIINTVVSAMPKDIVQQCLNNLADDKKFVKLRGDLKSQKDIPYLRISDFVIEDDGSILIAGDQKYDKKDGGYTYNYAYGATKSLFENNLHIALDIVVVKLNSDATLSYIKRLPKRQKEFLYSDSKEYGVEYKLMNVPGTDNYCFLFLDAPENTGTSESSLPEWYQAGKNGMLCSYNVNKKTGEFTKEVIFDPSAPGYEKLQRIRVLQLVMDNNGKMFGRIGNKKGYANFRLSLKK